MSHVIGCCLSLDMFSGRCGVLDNIGVLFYHAEAPWQGKWEECLGDYRRKVVHTEFASGCGDEEAVLPWG